MADVRDWAATAARYAAEPRREWRVAQPTRSLHLVSETALDPERRRMHVREHYVGTVDGRPYDETYAFVMRSWTPE